MAAQEEGRLHMQLPSHRSSLCGVGQPESVARNKKGEPCLSFLLGTPFLSELEISPAEQQG